MNKILLKCVIALLLFGVPALSQASPLLGWWEVRNTDQSAAGIATGWHVCLSAGGKWDYYGYGKKRVSGEWVSLDDNWTMLLGLSNKAALGSYAAGFVLKKMNNGKMSGAYAYTTQGRPSGKAYDDILLYKGSKCAPNKKVAARTWQPPKKPAPKKWQAPKHPNPAWKKSSQSTDTHIAMAVSKSTGYQWTAWSKVKAIARYSAMTQCNQGSGGRNDCSIVINQMNVCTSFAQIEYNNGARNWGYWWNKNRAIAQRNALSQCFKNSRGKPCKTVITACSWDK